MVFSFESPNRIRFAHLARAIHNATTKIVWRQGIRAPSRIAVNKSEYRIRRDAATGRFSADVICDCKLNRERIFPGDLELTYFVPAQGPGAKDLRRIVVEQGQECCD